MSKTPFLLGFGALATDCNEVIDHQHSGLIVVLTPFFDVELDKIFIL